jgi:hypothetical protein
MAVELGLPSRREHRLRASDSSVLRRIFGLRYSNSSMEKYITRNFTVYSGHLILLRPLNKMDEIGGTHRLYEEARNACKVLV